MSITNPPINNPPTKTESPKCPFCTAPIVIIKKNKCGICHRVLPNSLRPAPTAPASSPKSKKNKGGPALTSAPVTPPTPTATTPDKSSGGLAGLKSAVSEKIGDVKNNFNNLELDPYYGMTEKEINSLSDKESKLLTERVTKYGRAGTWKYKDGGTLEDGNVIPPFETHRDTKAKKAEEKARGQKEKEEAAKEIENLSPKERVEIAKGFNNIGFRVEKKKNEFFANQFGKIFKKAENSQSRVARFCKGLETGYLSEAKSAEKKSRDAAEGKGGWRMKLQNPGLLIGSVARTGRMISDMTGLSLASPLRYVMLVSKGVTRVATAGKEARLANQEEVIAKTRIGKNIDEYTEGENDAEYIADVNRAWEEAMRIKERAEKSGDVTTESLKQAYLREMPQDLQARLKNPSAANSLIQKFVKFDVSGAIQHLEDQISSIEKNKKLSDEQKEEKILALLRRQEKNLEDWDRIITQYGTVDGWAMAGRYLETAGKTVTAVVTLETLALSAEKVWSTVSNLFHNHDIALGAGVIKYTGKNIKPNDTLLKKWHGMNEQRMTPNPVVQPPTPDAAAAQGPKPFVGPTQPEAGSPSAASESIKPPTPPPPTGTPEPAPEIIPKATTPPETTPTTEGTLKDIPGTTTPEKIPTGEGFTEGIKFENGKGAIQGIKDLKDQMRLQYKNDFSKAPESIQKFMADTNITQQAIKLGLYDPEQVKESALIHDNVVIKFDKAGNFLFGTPDASGNIPVLEKYTGTMFDSDNSGAQSLATEKISTPKVEAPDTAEVTPEETPPPTPAPAPAVEEVSKAEVNPIIAEGLIKEGFLGDPGDRKAVAEFLENLEKAKTPASIPTEAVADGEPTVTSKEEEIARAKRIVEEQMARTTPISRPNTIRVGETIRVGSTIEVGGPRPGEEILNADSGPRNIKYSTARDGFWGDRSFSLRNGDFAGLSREENNLLKMYPEFHKNIFGLSGQKLLHAWDTHTTNITKIFYDNPRYWEDSVKMIPAKDMLYGNPAEMEGPLTTLNTYVRNLQKVTGLSPDQGLPARPWYSLGRPKAETTEEYIARALQWAANRNKLDQIEVNSK